jgi:rhodanese-related sulfurtransferase
MGGRATIGSLLQGARGRLDRLEPDDAAAAMEAGAMLIDTRCAELRVRDGVIPGSVHVPLSVLFWRLDPSSEWHDPALANPSRPIVLICAHGYSSSLAAATLLDLGYANVDVVSGFEAWVAAGFL